MNLNIGIISVFYNPAEDCAKHFIDFAQAGFLVAIANNGIDEDQLKQLNAEKNIFIIGGGENIGLAAALNECIKYLLDECNVKSVVLFDQDSRPTVDLPLKLEKSYKLLKQIGAPACIGPRLIDKKMNEGNYFSNKVKFLNVETIATSGTYIPSENLRKIGLMRGDLFIDCIDHEWCFRAISNGFKIYIDQENTMKHDMGENGINWFGVYKPVYKSPIRHYYIVRNTIYMLKLNYIPISWRFKEFAKLIRRVVFYVVFSNQPFISVKNIAKAVIHGVLGRLGSMG